MLTSNKWLLAIVKKIPNCLFVILVNLYFALTLRKDNVLLLPKGSYWFLFRRDSTVLIFPKSVKRIFRPDPYEHFFKIMPDDVVLDVGACIGDTTLSFAKKAKMVIAIEAEPQNCKYLKTNVVINKLNNVHIVEKAVWSNNKILTLYLNDDISLHSCIVNRGHGKVKVQADTIDNIVSELGIEKVDVIKIDVEGAEIEVLKGAEATLCKAKKIVIESHLIEKNQTRKIEDFLKKKGFNRIVKIKCGTTDLIFGEKYNS